MATWQFDFHFVPSDSVTRYFGATPTRITDEEFDERSWWTGHKAGRDLEAEMDSILPRIESWNVQLQQWGSDDGNRIDLLRDATDISDVFVRVDTRHISHTFLSDIVEIARRYRLLLRLVGGRIIRPSVSKLLSEIKASRAFQFSEDPKGFLESLDGATRDE